MNTSNSSCFCIALFDSGDDADDIFNFSLQTCHVRTEARINTVHVDRVYKVKDSPPDRRQN